MKGWLEEEKTSYQKIAMDIMRQPGILAQIENLVTTGTTLRELEEFCKKENLDYPISYYIEVLKHEPREKTVQEKINRFYYQNDIYYRTHQTECINTWTNHDATEEELKASLNPQILSYIKQNLPSTLETQLEQAIGIYILLGDIIRYDTRYLKHQDFSKLDAIDKIDLTNNEIICRQWAIMYHKLLEEYQIPSSIYGKFHLSVSIPINQTIYDADGFSFGQDEIISDVGRIQFGLKITGFKVLEVPSWQEEEEQYKNQELQETIDEVYKKLGRRVITDRDLTEKMVRLSENLAKHSHGNTKKEIKKRIRLLNWLYQLPLGIKSNVERYQLIRQYSHFLFDDFPFSSIQTTSVYHPKEQDLDIFRVIKIKDNEQTPHFYLQSEEGFCEYSQENLTNLIEQQQLIPRHKAQVEEFFGISRKNQKILEKKRR